MTTAYLLHPGGVIKTTVKDIAALEKAGLVEQYAGRDGDVRYRVTEAGERYYDEMKKAEP